MTSLWIEWLQGKEANVSTSPCLFGLTYLFFTVVMWTVTLMISAFVLGHLHLWLTLCYAAFISQCHDVIRSSISGTEDQ